MTRLNLFVCLLLFANTTVFGNEPFSHRGSVSNLKLQQTKGEPWPMPQSIQTSNQRQVLQPNGFQFVKNDTSQTCDILTGAFDRYYQSIFFSHSYFSYLLGSPSLPPSNKNKFKHRTSNISAISVLEKLYVYVQQPCDQWPSLESNESCIHY